MIKIMVPRPTTPITEMETYIIGSVVEGVAVAGEELTGVALEVGVEALVTLAPDVPICT